MLLALFRIRAGRFCPKTWIFSHKIQFSGFSGDPSVNLGSSATWIQQHVEQKTYYPK